MNIVQMINPKGRSASIRELPTATKIAAILIVLLAIATTFLAIRVGGITREALLERELIERQTISQVEAVKFVRTLDHQLDELGHFTESPLAQEGLLSGTANPAAQTELQELLQENEHILAAALISQNNQVVAIDGATEGTLPNPAEWEWNDSLTDARDGDLFMSGEIRGDGLTGLEGFHVAIPVFNTRTFERIGTFYAVLNPLSLAPAQYLDNDDLWLAVYDAGGGAIISTNRFGNNLRSDVSDRILEEDTGGSVSTTGATPYFYGWARISDLGLADVPATSSGWIVSVQENANPALTEINAISSSLQIGIIITAAILLVILLTVVFLLFRPLIELAFAAEQIAATDELEVTVPQGGQSYDAKMLSNGLKSLLGRLQYRARQLEAAAAVSKESVQHEIRALLDQAAHTIHDRLPYPEVYIYLMEPDGLRARVVAAYGLPGRNLLKVGTAVVLTEKQALGRGVLGKRTEWFDGVKAAFAGKNDEPAEVAIPFADAVGALHIIGNGPHTFAKPDVDMLELIANEIGAIVENRRLFETAEAAKEEAEQANRIKSQFLANMSHELRTPLNAILNFTGFVADGDVGPVNQEQKDLLDKVYQSGEHLLNLINDILDLSKIEAGMLQFLMEDVELNRILESTISTSKGLVKQKPIDLLAEIEEGLPVLVGDKRRLRQVFLNLMSNAIKFTTDGHVKLRAFNENGSIHVMVEDTGAGIPPEDQHLVFETFRQAKHEFEVGGTGLGLSISKHFIEAHGGRIWFESVHHEGTIFHVTLPIKAAVDEMDAAAAMN